MQPLGKCIVKLSGERFKLQSFVITAKKNCIWTISTLLLGGILKNKDEQKYLRICVVILLIYKWVTTWVL